MKRLIAIDPGQKKCGLLLADLDHNIVLDGRVVEQLFVIDVIISWKSEGNVSGIILGNGTSSKYWQSMLSGLVPIEIVEEKGTTLRARARYWDLWPPGIWLRWLPRGLLVPSQHLDAVAALVLLEDHVKEEFEWPGSPDFKISHEP